MTNPEDETKEQLEDDLAELARCDELHKLAEAEIESCNEAQAKCEELLVQLRDLTAKATMLDVEHDRWAATMLEHTQRAGMLIQESQRIRVAVEDRIAARKAGANPRKLEA